MNALVSLHDSQPVGNFKARDSVYLISNFSVWGARAIRHIDTPISTYTDGALLSMPNKTFKHA